MQPSGQFNFFDGTESQELIDSVIPQQSAGGQSHADIPFTCTSIEAADAVFENLNILLAKVNHWHKQVRGGNGALPGD